MSTIYIKKIDSWQRKALNPKKRILQTHTRNHDQVYQLNQTSKRSIKVTLLAIGSLTVMAAATIAPAIPQMSTAFSNFPDSEFLVKLVLILPSLIIGMVAPFMGALIDRIGRKPLLLFGLCLYAVAGTAGYYLTDLHWILVSRALLGVAVGCNMTTVTTLVADYFYGQERSQFMGIQGGFMAMGGIVYVILGGLLAMLSWREPFLIYATSLLVIPLVLLYIKEPEKPRDLLDESTFKYNRKLVNFVFFTGFLGMVIFYMIPVQMPFFLEKMEGMSELKIGLAIATTTLSAGPAAFCYQWMKARMRFTQIYALGFFIMSIGYILISFSDSYLEVVGSLCITGIGFGVMIPNASVWIMELAPVKIRGRIIGSLNAAMFLGQFFSPLVTEPITDNTSLEMTFRLFGILMLLLTAGFLFGGKLLRKLGTKE